MKGSHVYVVIIAADRTGRSVTHFPHKAFKDINDAYLYTDELFKKGFVTYVTALEVE